MYARSLLEHSGYQIVGCQGTLLQVQGFPDYNHLIDINAIFSTSPRYSPVDRTGTILGPIRHAVSRPWQPPQKQLTLDQALQCRVGEICSSGQPVNIFWSGGIDSTTIMVAFLKHAPNIRQCRVIYSPWSTYEHPEFFQLLRHIPDLEMIDISGDTYFDLDLDGIFVSGNTGDEMHASLDLSFYQTHGWRTLTGSWRDFFRETNPCPDFMRRCEEFFARAGKPIDTVLEARWWFYASTKLTSILNTVDLNWHSSAARPFAPARLIGFFDCDCYEQFIYHNLQEIIPTDDYVTWKQFLKDYCCGFDGLQDWARTKSKFHSSQLTYYADKKPVLNDCRNLLLLEDGTRVATANLPLFSRREWLELKPRYEYLFRPPHAMV